MRCLGCMTEYPSEYGVCPHCGYEPGTPAESALHMQPGSILAGRYLIGRVIGYGGFGVTYIGWDDTLRQRVAIKEYLPSEFATRAVGQTQVTVFSGNKAQQFADGMAKFIDEAKRLVKFQNEPGIVRVYDSFEANNTAYIVMEYLDGETLTAYLDREGKVPVEQAIKMLTPVIRSLEAVHKVGIIHRDIAPDNIMLTKDGHVKLIDFGAARYATTSHSRSLTVIIKPGYSPEEQYRSRGDQGPHTDVYALAAVLYRMVTGITPPDALERRAFYENKKKDILIPVSKNCKIEKSKENAILNAMNVRIEDRTKTAEDFLKELTSTTPVKRLAGKIKAIDLMKWPLWAKIIIPVGGAAAVVLIALLLTGRIGFTNDLITSFTMGADMTRVPSVINCSVGVAQDDLDAQELTSVISGRETSDIIPANMVLRQGIDAGEVVPKGSSVELYVSAAAEPLVEDGSMPDVSFYTAAEAQAMLEQLGAIVTVEEEYSSDVADGLVIRASVGYGEPLAEGDAVTLYVSLGPDPAAAEDPDGDRTNTPSTTSVTLNRSSLSLFVGDTVSLSASGGNGSFSWSSSNSNVASVRNGSVTAVGKGSATITVTSNGRSASCAVTVQDYSLSISESNISMFTGESRTLSASGAPSGTSVTWSSSNSRVATVSGGRVTAVSSGSATITAQFTTAGRSYSASCQVSVSTSGITLSRYSISSLYVGESETISATTSPSGQSVSWSSSNTRVATVSNGRITAVGAGSATITASFSYNGSAYSETCSVTVREVSVSLSQSSLTMTAGDTESLSATVSPSGTSASWTSSNTDVATVSSSGRVTAVSDGSATITAEITVNGRSYTDTCRVTVEEPSIRLSSSSLSLNVGDSETLSASVTPSGTSVSWSSSNTNVATVSSSGRINAVASGSSTITASISYGGRDYSVSCNVSVEAASIGVSVEVYESRMTVGDSQSLRIITTTADYDDIQVTSSNTAIATVSSSNLSVSAVGPGTATITVTITKEVNGKIITGSDSCTISVEQASSALSIDSFYAAGSNGVVTVEFTVSSNYYLRNGTISIDGGTSVGYSVSSDHCTSSTGGFSFYFPDMQVGTTYSITLTANDESGATKTDTTTFTAT